MLLSRVHRWGPYRAASCNNIIYSGTLPGIREFTAVRGTAVGLVEGADGAPSELLVMLTAENPATNSTRDRA